MSKISEIKKKFLEDLGIDINNLPMEFNMQSKDMEAVLTNEEIDFLGRESLTGTYTKTFSLKDLIGTTHPNYSDKSWIAAFLTSKRGDQAVEQYYKNPEYYSTELKQLDQSMLTHDTPIELYESDGKFFIKGGNNRLSLIMMKYLSEISKAQTEEEKAKIDEEYTFVAQVNPIPKDKDIMYMINIIRNSFEGNVRITRIGEKEEEYHYIIQIDAKTVDIQSKGDLEQFIRESYNLNQSKTVQELEYNLSNLVRDGITYGADNQRILNTIFPNLQEFKENFIKLRELCIEDKFYDGIDLKNVDFSELLNKAISIREKEEKIILRKQNSTGKTEIKDDIELPKGYKINEFGEIIGPEKLNIQQENRKIVNSDNSSYPKKQNSHFFEEKEKLQQAEKEMKLVTQKYNEFLKKFDTNQLLNTALIYDYKKAQTQYLLRTSNTQIDEQDRKVIDENFSQHIKNNFGIECGASDIGKLIEESNITSKSVQDTIKLYKEELSNTYMKYSPVLRHATNIEGLSKINASQNRENQYLNEVVNAVFASSGYNDMENYIGRANVGGMQVVGEIVAYPSNPFEDRSKIKEDGNVRLKDKVYLYSMDARKFEPVVDFSRNNNGNYKLDFDQEWISRNDSVECECEIIDSVPKEVFKQKQFFYKNEKIDVRTLTIGKSKEEITKNFLTAINSGKLGYINGELGIGEMVRNEWAKVQLQNNIQTNNNQFSWKQKVAQLLQKSNILMNISLVEKFVDKQLNVLPSPSQQRISNVNSSRESFVNRLSNNEEYRNLSQIQRMSDPEKIVRMQRTMEQNQQSNEDNGPSL